MPLIYESRAVCDICGETEVSPPGVTPDGWGIVRILYSVAKTQGGKETEYAFCASCTKKAPPGGIDLIRRMLNKKEQEQP